MHNDIHIIQQNILYQGKYFYLKNFNLQFKKFNNTFTKAVNRNLLMRNPCVGVLLYDENSQEIILIEQFRIGAIDSHNPWLLEIVAGLIEESDSNVVNAAHRETLEESGCKIQKLIPITKYYASPGYTDEFVHLYLGIVNRNEVVQICGNAHEDEDIRTKIIPAAKALSLCTEGKVINSMSIIALQWFHINYIIR